MYSTADWHTTAPVTLYGDPLAEPATSKRLNAGKAHINPAFCLEQWPRMKGDSQSGFRVCEPSPGDAPGFRIQARTVTSSSTSNENYTIFARYSDIERTWAEHNGV